MKVSVLTAVLLMSVAWPARFVGQAHPADAHIKTLVRKVKSARSNNTRFDAAKSLRNAVEKTEDQISDSTIHDIAALLDIHDDGARMWVASALSVFGKRAQFAAPKLLAILKDADCYITETSSAETIRAALKKIDGKAPLKQSCVEYIDPHTGKRI